MATPVKAPDINVNVTFPTIPVAVPSLRERIKKILKEIFEGHEEYLGCTPD